MSENPESYSTWNIPISEEKTLKEWYVIEKVVEFIEANDREPSKNEYDEILNGFNFVELIAENKPIRYSDYYIKIKGIEPPQPAVYVTVYVDGVSTQYEVSPNNEDVNLWDSNNVHYTKASQLTNGASYTAISPAGETTGTTDGHNWVQLWENGPKFAVCNYGSPNDNVLNVGSKTYRTHDGDWTAWGSNWRAPIKEDLDELYTAARFDTSDKISCQFYQNYENSGINVIIFTGKQEHYTSNKVIFACTSTQYNVSIDLQTMTQQGTSGGNKIYYYLWLAGSISQQTTKNVTNFNTMSEWNTLYVRPIINE